MTTFEQAKASIVDQLILAVANWTGGKPMFPDVSVQLSGENGNAFNIIGQVRRALQAAGYRDEADAFRAVALEVESYDDLLTLAMTTVEVT